MSERDAMMAVWRLSTDLARARDEGDVAAAVARAAVQLSDAEVARVWMIDRVRGYRFAGGWPEGRVSEDVPGEVVRSVVFGTPQATSAEPPFRSRMVIPLLSDHRPLGAVELLEERREAGAFSPADASSLTGLVAAADAGLGAARDAARKEAGLIAAVTRLTRLFDLGRSLVHTLEVDDLVRGVANRVRSSLEVEGVYVWVADEAGEGLELAGASGPAAGAVLGWELARGDGLAGRVMETGQSILVDDEAELAELGSRPDVEAGLEIHSVAAAPIAPEEGEKCLGVIEVVNKEDGQEYLVRNDVTFLEEAAATTALALDNARRLDAERRAGDLGSLLDVAQELSSHLDVQKVAFALVHKAASVIRYKRAAVALYRGARLELAAVSGRTFVDETLPDMKVLRELLEWAAGLEEGLYVVQEEDGSVETERPETSEKFKAYFEASGSKSFLSVPLHDDEGKLGVFAIEADAPYAFSGRHIEAAGLLGTQGTVAIRNATLYQQIPMVRVFEPLSRRKERFLSLPWARKVSWIGGTAVLAAVLVLVPVPLRVSGQARVLPELPLPVTAEVEGRVAQVLVSEGDAVEAGQVLALLDDADYRAGWQESSARYQVALREQSRFRAGGEAAGAAVEAARLEGLQAEMDLWQTRLERTRVRASVSGVVATPRLEEKVGARLERGEVFCEVVDPDRQLLEIELAEQDVGLVRDGQRVKIKLNAFPTRAFRATVERVGVAATVDEARRFFLVRARFDEVPVKLRSGMTGRAKVDTGPASVGRVLLRRPGRWLWSIVWGWLG